MLTYSASGFRINLTHIKAHSYKEENMLVNSLRVIILCALSGLLFGCATMFAPGEDQITIKTDPGGAEVYDGATLLGKTPLTHTFARDTFEKKVLTVKMEGRKSHSLYLQKTMEKTALLNFGFITTTFGVTSWGVDAFSGHMTKYSPNSYLIELESAGGVTTKEEQSRRRRLRFVVLNSDSLRKDIARGDGEHLRAYYALRPSAKSSESYRDFAVRMAVQSGSLIEVQDAVDFGRELGRR